MTITTLAASQTEQDGVETTLTSGKNSYAANEKIDLELTVINNNAYEVDGIQTEITLPDGITLESGNLIQEEFTLSAKDKRCQALLHKFYITLQMPGIKG